MPSGDVWVEIVAWQEMQSSLNIFYFDQSALIILILIVLFGSDHNDVLVNQSKF